MSSSSVEVTSGDAVQELARRVAALERLAALADRIPALEREVAALRGERGEIGVVVPSTPATPVPADLQLLERVWHTAPLPARLEFLRSQLPSGGRLAAALQETARLVGLLDRKQDLESWIRDYPSMFADAFATLSAPETSAPGNDAEELAQRTLGEARYLLETQVRLLGIEWIEPGPNDPVTEVHSVVEEVAGAGAAPGRVSACRRRGFRWNGEVQLPALVARQPEGSAPPRAAEFQPPVEPTKPAAAWSRAGDEAESVELNPRGGGVAVATASAPSPAPVPMNRPEQPAWLMSLQRSIPNGDRTTAGALTRGLADLVTRLNSGSSELPDYEITVALKPLLALLGTGAGVWRPDLPQPWTEAFQRGRPELLAWLSEHLALEIFVPVVGEAFSLETMQMTAERRTAHPHEWGTVARVEAPGLVRGGQVLLPARVVRYESGGGA